MWQGLKQQGLTWTSQLSWCVFLAILLAAVFAHLLTPYDPNEQALLERLLTPSLAHPLGTDHLGRDLLARVLYGGRFSLLLSAIATLVTAVIGLVVALISVRFGGWVDEAMMRLVDLFLSFPSFALSLIIAALLEPSFWTLVLAMCVTGWTPYARLARAAALETQTKVFVEAARALGGTRNRILLKHVLPSMLSPILATVFLRFGHTLLSVAGLSFLGLGAQPPTADWGAMLAEARPYMQRSATIMLVPGLAIFITTMSVTLIGRGLTNPLGRQ